VDPRGILWVSLRPYEVLWLTPDDDDLVAGGP